MPSVVEGERPLPSMSIVISNVGNQETGNLEMNIVGDLDEFGFDILTLPATMQNIPIGYYRTWTINAGFEPTGSGWIDIPVGTYSIDITISGENIAPHTVTITFTVNPPQTFPVGFAVNNVTRNGLTAMGGIFTETQVAGTPISAIVSFGGTATVAGTHTIGLTSETGVVISSPLTKTVAAGEVIPMGYLLFNFTMPAHAVGDLVIVHTFTPDDVAVPVTGVTIPGATTRNMEVGQTLALTANVQPANATNPAVTWVSSNPAVARVNANGVVTAVSAGSATITVTTVDGGLRESVVVNVTAPIEPPQPPTPPTDPGVSIGTGNWSGSAPAQQNQAATNAARANHTSIQNQLTAANGVVLTAHAATNRVELQGSSLNALVQAGVPLTIRSANGSFEIELPPAFLGEFHRRGTTNGEFSVGITYVQDGGAIVVGEIEFRTRNSSIERFQNAYTVITHLDGRIPAGMNRMRITAIQNERNLGGGFSEGSRFEFEMRNAGRFAVAYVETLRRITVALDSYVIRDLADNAPMQTMDVLPVIQNDRTLLPIRFVAYALGAEVDWNPATSEVTLTLGEEALTFAIGQMAPGMDVPAQIMNERTMVPLRFISEFFGAVVHWDDVTRSIEIVR